MESELAKNVADNGSSNESIKLAVMKAARVRPRVLAQLTRFTGRRDGPDMVECKVGCPRERDAEPLFPWLWGGN